MYTDENLTPLSQRSEILYVRKPSRREKTAEVEIPDIEEVALIW